MVRVFAGDLLAGVFRLRPDGRYQRRVHSRVYTREDLYEWVERMNAVPNARARWRIENTVAEGEPIGLAVAVAQDSGTRDRTRTTPERLEQARVMAESGRYTVTAIAEAFEVSRQTIYRRVRGATY